MFRQVLWWLLVLMGSDIAAQGIPHVWHFPKSVYGAQNQNWGIAQGEDGTMFFANNAGVLEFDGATWRVFPLPDGQVARSVACLGGRVYTGGFGEFGYFEADVKSRRVYRSLSKSMNNEALLREEIWHLLARQSPQKQVLFQSFSKVFSYDGLQVREYKPPSNLMFIQEVGGKLWFQGIGKGLFELTDDGSFRFLEASEALKDFIVAFIVSDNDGGLLVGTKNNGLFRFKDGLLAAWDKPANAMLKSLQPNKAVRLPDGRLAVGTVLSGVFVFDAEEQLQFHLHQEAGLQNNTVLSMCADRNGNLWLGLDKGIDLVELNSDLQWHHDLSGRLGTVYTAALFGNQLYLGTNHGVFVRPWQPSGSTSKFEFIAGTQGQVWDLQVFDGQLICGHNEGTFLISGQKSQRISDVTGGWQTIQVPNRPDLLLQGTYTGIVVFKKERNGQWTFSHRVENFGDAVRKLAFDQEGSLWAAHPNRGLWRLRLDDNLQKCLEHKQFGPEDGLPSDFKADIVTLPEGLAFQSGQHILTYTGGKLKPYQPKLPLHRRLIAFPDGSVFAPKGNEIAYHGRNGIGYLPVELVPGHENIVQISPDVLLFCLESGFAVWQRNRYTAKKNIPNALKINQIDVISNPNLRIYPIDHSDTEHTFAARDNNLRLYCSMPYFTGLPQISWKLQGPDKQQGTLGRHDFIELTNLSPGSYELLLTTSDGVTGNFRFVINNPWWRTWWGILIWLSLLLLVGYSVEVYNKRRLDRQRELLQTEKERALGIQRNEAERRQMLSELENKNRELSNTTLSLIRKNETLAELKKQLEDLQLTNKDYGKLDRLIENHLSGDNDWEIFENAFNQVHDEFFKKLKLLYPELTPGDLRLAALLKLNLASKEVASLLGISVRGIENKRYRLRKKMNLGDKDNLTEFLMGL